MCIRDRYEGHEGLRKHMKDVQDYTMNQVSAVAGNVGLAWGGLTANAATQALKKTSKFVGRSTRAMNNVLEGVQNFGNASMRYMVRGLNYMGRGVSTRLESLSDMLDRLVSSVMKKRKRRRRIKARPPTDGDAENVNATGAENQENQPANIFA